MNDLDCQHAATCFPAGATEGCWVGCPMCWPVGSCWECGATHAPGLHEPAPELGWWLCSECSRQLREAEESADAS